jgi:predicted helicase
MEGAFVLDLRQAYEALEHRHALLSRSLEFLTDREARAEISASLGLLQRIIHEIPADLLKATSAKQDPWLFFYEDFLAAYDADLRKKSGVYFTPIEVVRCQVRLIDEILREDLGRPMGFVEAGVATLDPALGTGTYLLGIVDHALARIAKEEGPGAVKGGARVLVHNLHGFEWMVGPYAVAQLRFSLALSRQGITLPETGPGIYLTNTLESPHTHPPAPPLFTKRIAREHERALKIKDQERILVCLGNPPYGRHEAAAEDNQAITGGWVRFGDRENDPDRRPILEDFLDPARQAGFGVHLKNLYNLYVYFIRWSLWKVFEHRTATGPGILSFITASSYLDGDAFVGLREQMRRVCERIDIIDLGGEGRGTRKEENVFAIQTPVAIFVAWRKGKPDPGTPAIVRYARIEGTREEKLEALDAVHRGRDLPWQEVPNGWRSPFVPGAQGVFSRWPLITDLFPWQNNGVKAGRTWVIGPSREVLEARIEALEKAPKEERPGLFKNSPTGRKWGESAPDLSVGQELPPLPNVNGAQEVRIRRYGFRSLDRQYVVADARFLDRPGPALWRSFSDKQVLFSSLFNHPLGAGPAVTLSSYIPDLHHYRGSFGAKEIMPLFRDVEGTKPNIAPGLLDFLEAKYGEKVAPEAFAGYIYALLAQPEYTRRFANELIRKEVRVPWTKDAKLFAKVAAFGKKQIWLHTYGERLHDVDHPKGQVPQGKALCVKAVSGEEEHYPNEFRYTEETRTLHVGDGAFAPVSSEVLEFEVSGLKVVQSWLGYRMKDRSGKKSSPLDDIRPKAWTREFTRELLELLWVLEKTVTGYPKQKQLLESVLASDLFQTNELPPVPDSAREAPKIPRTLPGQARLKL